MRLLLPVAIMAVSAESFSIVSSSTRSSSTRISYSTSPSNNPKDYDDGGLDAYAKALEAAYGAAKAEIRKEQQLQPPQLDNNDDEWITNQVEDFLDKDAPRILPDANASYSCDSAIKEQANQETQASNSPPLDAPTTNNDNKKENDIADDFIALKYDIENYVFTETKGTSLFVSEETTTTRTDQPLEPTTSALEQFAQEIDTPWVDDDDTTTTESALDTTAETIEPLEAELPTVQEPQTIELMETDEPILEQAEIVALEKDNDEPTLEEAKVVVQLDGIEDPPVLPKADEEKEETTVMEQMAVTPDTIVDETVPATDENDPALQMRKDFEELEMPTISDELVFETEDGLVTREVGNARVDRKLIIRDDTADAIEGQPPNVSNENMNALDTENQKIGQEPVAEADLEMPTIADELVFNDKTVSPTDVESQASAPEPTMETEPLTIQTGETTPISDEAKDVELPILDGDDSVVKEDLSFAISEPEIKTAETTAQVTASNDTITDIDDKALNDLVAAIEKFDESDDAEELLAALESNPLSEQLVQEDPKTAEVEQEDTRHEATSDISIEEETAAPDSGAARIVNVNSSEKEQVQSLQATNRPPVSHENAEPPAVFKFIGSLSKDLQEHATKKIPEELKPIANIAGNLWTNTFGKWTEAIAHGTHKEEQVDAPSEVFYFNLNTQEGEWDPTSEDISKSQMLSNEQGKSWTATIDSRGNFYVHYYDSDEDVPAPQLIATDSKWDQFSTGGRVYYVNRESGTSQWEEPEDFGLEEKAVHSLHQYMGKSQEVAEREVDLEHKEEATQSHGKVGFKLPSLFENIAAKSKAAKVENKVFFEPKPPTEVPLWKLRGENHKPSSSH